MTLGIAIRASMAPEGVTFIAERVIIAIVLKTTLNISTHDVFLHLLP